MTQCDDTLRFHSWVVSHTEYNKNPRMILATCDCGTQRQIRRRSLDNGVSKSCGCQKRKNANKTNLEKYGTEHTFNAQSVKEKIKKTNIDRYGSENPFSSDIIKEKIKKTNIDRYGSENPFSSDIIKEKIKETNIDRYGVEHSMQNKEVKEKSKATMRRRYGVEHPSHSDEINDKKKKTCIERYGKEYTLSVDKFIEARKKTNLKKYGVEHTLSVSSVREKIAKTRSEGDFRSAGELELKEWIQSNFDVEVEKSYIGGNNPKEIDILIKKNNINILAIEYNGDYWHSEANKSMHKNYHKHKTEQTRIQKKCQLIHIFESEWKEKKDIIKGFIRSKLERGISVRASKCEVREVPWEDVKEFCNNYHLQGKPQHSALSLGLYHNDELLSLMTFSKPHRQNMGSEYHLSRYAIRHGYRIHGGLSRLSKHAHKRIGDFITYVHLRLSSGESYINTGYRHESVLPPDYWYIDIKSNNTVSKQSRRKSRVNTPEGMTEKEHAEINGLKRIWDCGKLKLSYRG